MSRRTITLTVDQPRFFDEVSKYGLINSTCPIGSRVIACLLGGVDWREAAGLGVYGVEVEEAARQHIRAIVETKAPGQRQPRERDNGYLQFLRRLPCVIDGVTPSDAAHIRFTNLAVGRVNPGMAKKPHDRHAVPLCRACHTDQHANNEAAWWARHGIDPDALSASLYAAFLAGQDGSPIIRRFAGGGGR